MLVTELSERTEHESLPAGAIELNYSEAFAAMAVRRFQRRWFGTHVDLSFTRMVSTFMALVLFSLYFRYHRSIDIGSLSDTLEPGSGERVGVVAVPQVFVDAVIGAISFACFVSCCCGRGGWLVRWGLYMYLLGTLVLITFEKPDDMYHQTGWLGAMVYTCWSVLFLLILLTWITCEFFIPFIGRRRWLCFGNVTAAYRIRPIGPENPNHFNYVPAEPQGLRLFWPCSLWCGREATFSYVGEQDADGRPHGMGRWTDSEYHGECLKGFWRHGIPVGPFRSVEQGSGYGLSSVRIGFGSCTSETDWQKTNMMPTSAPLRMGLAAVEASTNGQFYRHLPSATLLQPPNDGASFASRSARWVLDRLLHIEDDETDVCRSLTVTVTEHTRRLAVTGHVLAPGADGRRAEVELTFIPAPSTLELMRMRLWFDPVVLAPRSHPFAPRSHPLAPRSHPFTRVWILVSEGLNLRHHRGLLQCSEW